MHIRILICAFLTLTALPVQASDGPDSLTPVEKGMVYIGDQRPTDLRQTLALRVQAPSQTVLPQDIDFRCTIVSLSEYDDIVLTLAIQPENGPVLFEGSLTVDLVAGDKEVVLRWPTDVDIADGEYEVLLTAEQTNGVHMASTRLAMRKLSEGLVADTLDQASAAVQALDDHVSRLGEETFTSAVLQRLAIATETVRSADEAWRDGNWSQTYDHAIEALEATASERAGLTFAALTPERLAEGPVIASKKLSIRNSAIKSDSTPVFLYGVRLSLAQAQHIAKIGRFGTNAVVLELSPADVLPTSDSVLDLESVIGPILGECAELSMAIAIQLQPQKMSGWALDKWPDMARSQFDPFYYDVTHPKALDVLEKFYGAVGAYVDQEPRIFAVSVADAPRFRISDEPMRKGFAVYLRHHYDSDVSLNLAWQTRLPSIDEIPIRWDWEKRAYQAHLQRYHRDQVTGFFSWIVNSMGVNARNVPLTFTAPGTTFTIGSAKDGIDIESLGHTFAAGGTESTPAGPPSGYALSFPDAQMQITLTRSLNPSKPVFDFSARVGATPKHGTGVALHERARLWQAAIAGVDMNVVPFAALFEGGEGEVRPHDTTDLTGFVSGGETLNRLADIVQRFQQQAAPVAILWSDSSRMLDNGSPYLPSLRRAYEGAACFGLPIRFVSERQIAAGDLDTIDILVLPEALALADAAFDALDAYVEEGGRLVSTGSSIPYHEYGGSRALRLRASPLTKLVRGAENAGNYLRALDAAFEASDLEEFPRAMDDREYPILGVVSRYLEDDQGRYLYLVNLNTETETIHLPVGRLEGRDLIDGRTVRFPLEIEPLDPMLISLAPLDAEDVAAESTESPASDVPTAMIEPVPQDN